MRTIDADKLKEYYAWWALDPEAKKTKELFDAIIDLQPTVDAPSPCVGAGVPDSPDPESPSPEPVSCAERT